jgi:hypothetical protein
VLYLNLEESIVVRSFYKDLEDIVFFNFENIRRSTWRRLLNKVTQYEIL